jgi:hypothetical protein
MALDYRIQQPTLFYRQGVFVGRSQRLHGNSKLVSPHGTVHIQDGQVGILKRRFRKRPVDEETTQRVRQS